MLLLRSSPPHAITTFAAVSVPEELPLDLIDTEDEDAEDAGENDLDAITLRE